MDLTPEEENFRIHGFPQGKPITGFFTSDGNTAHLGEILYTVSDNFNQWQLWNGDGAKGFISVEPQCGAVNCLNSGHGLLRLHPGQQEIFSVWYHTA